MQAVLICDAQEISFSPLTLEKPRCLLPLNGIALISYAVEFLLVNGIVDIVLFVKSHNKAIEEFTKTIRGANISIINAPQGKV